MEARDLFEYTLMPMHNRSLFTSRELEAATLYGGFGFANGMPLLKVPALPDAKRSPMQGGFADPRTVLFDLTSDPRQMTPIDAHDVERDLCAAIAKEMQAHEAPRELYGRFGLENFC